MATSTPAPPPAPITGSMARTQQARTIAQEPSQENGSEEGAGSSGLQASDPDVAEFRKKMKNQLRNRIISPRNLVSKEDHDNQEEMETESGRRCWSRSAG